MIISPMRSSHLRFRRPWRRATMEVRTAMYDGVWNAMYFLLIVGFCTGNSHYAIALWRRRGLSRVVGGFYAAAAALTLQIIIVEPLARTLIGAWLWRHRDEDVASAPAGSRAT